MGITLELTTINKIKLKKSSQIKPWDRIIVNSYNIHRFIM
jgi:hypothetical protein